MDALQGIMYQGARHADCVIKLRQCVPQCTYKTNGCCLFSSARAPECFPDILTAPSYVWLCCMPHEHWDNICLFKATASYTLARNNKANPISNMWGMELYNMNICAFLCTAFTFPHRTIQFNLMIIHILCCSQRQCGGNGCRHHIQNENRLQWANATRHKQ